MVKPKLKTKNRSKELLKLSKQYAKELSVHKEIIGIAIGGGPTRGYADKYSDIDLHIYVDSKTFSKWEKKCPFPLGDYYWNGQLSEVVIYDYSKEIKRDWCLEDRWEASSFIIFSDTNSKIKKLLKNKIKWKKNEKKQLYYLSAEMACWFIIHLPINWIKRGDIAQAHYVMTKAIDWIFNCIFIKNNYFVPWNKWKLHYVLLMKKKPKNFKKELYKAMLIKSMTKKDVFRRQKLLINILKQLKIKPGHTILKEI